MLNLDSEEVCTWNVIENQSVARAVVADGCKPWDSAQGVLQCETYEDWKGGSEVGNPEYKDTCTRVARERSFALRNSFVQLGRLCNFLTGRGILVRKPRRRGKT